MSKVEQVLITIGMPVYNDRLFIVETLHSILNQSFKKFKLIISDDCSTDGSGDICLEYAKNDSRITYIRQENNIGISKNMQYLLSLADTEFFMWAGDDDLYHPDFIKQLLGAFQVNKNAVTVFCTCQLIDENGNARSKILDYNYQNDVLFLRLSNYIKQSTDYFGYGVFKTEKIKNVRFPVWCWPNSKTPYNNIYPTLCYYLSVGDYTHVYSEPLFFKRVKSGKNVHHIITGNNNAIKESFSFWIRKLNLSLFSAKEIYRAANLFVAIKVFPLLFWHWFIVPSFGQFSLACKSFWNHKIKKTV